MVKFKLFALITVCTLFILNPVSALKVGVYDNPPLVFVENGEAKGFFIDILEYIAEEEGWSIEYVHDTFPRLLDKLERGEIDLLVDIAYTEERAEAYKFNDEAVFTNWGVVVGKQNLDSVLKLDGLKVAGVKRDVYTAELKRLVDEFNLNCQIFEIEGDYREVFEKVKAGRADAGVVSRIYASLYASDYGLKESSIIFGPVELRFAGRDDNVLGRIDAHLSAMKSDRNSVYYQSLDRWLGPRVEVIPQWVYYAIASLFAVLLAAIALNAYLSRVVAKRTEEVRKNEAFLRAIFNTIQDGISVLDKDMNVIMVNHAMERWYGNVVGKKCYEAYHNRSEPCEECPTIEAMKSGEMKRGVVPGLKGSEVEWLELFSYPLIENGEVKMVVEFVRDITEKKRMEEELRKALESYEYLWNSTNDILYVHDMRGCFTRVNRRAMELLGYEEGENVTVWDVVPESHHELVREKIREVVETKKPTEPFELPVKAKSGEILWLEVIAHPVIEKGEVVAVHGVARDVTERKKFIDEIGENIRLVSHLVDRIRNPLAAARAFCELREKLGGEAFEKVISNIDRVTELIEDLDRVWANLERLRRGLKRP
ncbi:PAS domain S-box protein [Archaeoglobus fulgidus]|uniref:Amino-acid ABC transporter, periplasmic binding protein/protein kinase n=3 Tax=Archaeoglobus fulgidus TaxID=2234 RepID=O28508_ARCFU|nr:PAS domain S-box protein [Archaeoglobus fulgidus]AAB89485.1 amino-acid ABC transporter, periplasmic binding protein/protein kinase [Archaeoglobus fulgidus DSM 4304]AIG98767.1 PAS domain protein S-box [Archaeoglobus fulgidus DSM 8774]